MSLPLLIVPIVALVIASYVGSALHPTLAVDHPLWLISLNARNYHLALVVPNVSLVAFAVVAFVRLVLSDPLFYVLGREHGEAGRAWVGRQVEGSDRIIGWLDRWFPRLGAPFVFVAPNNVVCLLAGVTGMKVRTFVLLNAAGTATRIAVIWWFGQVFEDQLLDVLDLFSRYQLPATLIAIALVGIQVVVSSRRSTGELSNVRELTEEIQEESEDPEFEPGNPE